MKCHSRSTSKMTFQCQTTTQSYFQIFNVRLTLESASANGQTWTGKSTTSKYNDLGLPMIQISFSINMYKKKWFSENLLIGHELHQFFHCVPRGMYRLQIGKDLHSGLLTERIPATKNIKLNGDTGDNGGPWSKPSKAGFVEDIVKPIGKSCRKAKLPQT